MIYLSAPYSKGDVGWNIRRACLVGDELLKRGYVPFIPHLNHLWHLISPKSYDTWLKLDLKLLSYCDALIRLSGESKGADLEVKEAERLCIPIYHSLAEFFNERVSPV